MPETAIVRLSPLALITDGMLPLTRSKELETVCLHRAAARGRLVSSVAMTGLCGLFAFAYGWIASWTWILGGPILLAVFASVFCAGLLVACLRLLGEVDVERQALRDATPSAELLEDASRERALAAAVDVFGAQVDEWNAALDAASETDVGARFMGRLVDAREALERRREALVAGIARAWVTAASASSAPKELPPPQDWGHTVRIDLKSP